jgi:hypothetical protein
MTGVKYGISAHFDLAIVAAVLAADDVFGVGELAGTVLLGELGLDGRVRPVRAVLPATLAPQRQPGFHRGGIGSEPLKAGGSRRPARALRERHPINLSVANLMPVYVDDLHPVASIDSAAFPARSKLDDRVVLDLNSDGTGRDLRDLHEPAPDLP